MGAVHNSRNDRYRFPQGAVSCGNNVMLALQLDGALAYTARRIVLCTCFDGNAEQHEGECTAENGMRLYRFNLKMPDRTGLLWYNFAIYTQDGVMYYGGSSGRGYLSEGEPASYRITVYDGSFSVPRRHTEGVMYQIFPDRFAKSGDEGGLRRLPYHENMGRRVYAHENWDELPLYLPLDGGKYYSPCDFFGGDLEGIRNRLKYLSDMGVTMLYLNPVFESPSCHRYNVSDYMRIDPILGDENDLKNLVESAKHYGIELMFDGVFSHTGDDSVYFDRYGNYGKNGAYQSEDSPYRDWYDFEEFPDKYRSWWGFDTLPEVNELAPSYVEYVKRVIDKWHSLGVKHWRLDVADELPDEFIAMLRQKVKGNSHDGVLIGEVWEEASNKHSMGCRRKYVDGFELDGVMDYVLRSLILDFLTGKISAGAFLDGALSQAEHYPEPFLYGKMNLLSSHDTIRAITVLGGAPGRDDLPREKQAEFRLDEDALKLAKRRFVLAVLMQAAMPGVPCVYYGDEVGMTGMADPFCRGTFPADGGDGELADKVRRIMRQRRTDKSLNSGGYALNAYGEDVLTVVRMSGESSSVVVVNRSHAKKTVRIKKEDFAQGKYAARVTLCRRYTDLLSGKEYESGDTGMLLELEPLEGLLLIRKD